MTVALQDFYAVLGVEPTASAWQIKLAFRRQAKRWHPDRCKAPDAAEQFRAAKRAHDLLIDPQTRAAIDVLLAQARATSAARIPHPDEVDPSKLRSMVLTTHGWMVPT